MTCARSPTCCVGYADAAAEACRLAADLARRTERLQAIAPKQRRPSSYDVDVLAAWQFRRLAH
jgi:hypothetical protein